MIAPTMAMVADMMRRHDDFDMMTSTRSIGSSMS